ncbi:MAG: hypothetical protein HN350_09990, partial [Phycisphaerales bacterium]|nr:hypothetical protein [Phycisphaerales bacterium]
MESAGGGATASWMSFPPKNTQIPGAAPIKPTKTRTMFHVSFTLLKTMDIAQSAPKPPNIPPNKPGSKYRPPINNPDTAPTRA